MPIRQLPAQLANQIAAGEVVERPSSVVKELVENSLDAGATELIIDIEQGGARRIRIRDNGSGITGDELVLALSRHATSKIASLDDLEAIMSLGFRGEALASISSVSRLTLTSRPPEQAEAWQAFCEGRDMQVQVQPAAHPVGTTVDVQDLFFNTPARRKFLRTEKTEFSHIDEVVKRIALARPDVRIRLSHNQRTVRDYKPVRGEHTQPRLQAITGRAFASEALVIEHRSDPWYLHGWIARPEHCRHQGDIQYMYVNGRMMRDKLLNHAIRQAYGEHLADDRQPTYVLYLQLPARDVDVNVHPAKHEVRFHQSRQVHDFVLYSVRQALHTPLDTGSDADSHLTGPAQTTEPEASYQPPPRHFYQKSADKPSAAAVAAYGALMQTGQPARMPEEDGEHTDADTQVPLEQGWRWLTQLDPGHILLQQEDTLAVSSVKVIQRMVQRARLTQQLVQGLSGQPLLVPVQLELNDPLQEHTVRQLAQLGVQLRVLSANRVVIMQVPTMLRHSAVDTSVSALLEYLPDSEQPLHTCEPLLDWLSAQGLAEQYSPDQARYWWNEVQRLDLVLPLRILNWRESADD